MTTECVILDPFDRQIEQLLASCNLRARVAPAAELATLAHPSSRQPGVLVLDLRGGKSIPATLPALKSNHPNTGVLIVAAAAEPALMLEAMRSGVNEFVVEPIAKGDLEAAVTRLLARHRPVVSGELFALLGAKGGVGTTTTAVNVASALGTLGHGKTLLIDLHLAHGDAAVFLGADPRFSVMDALENTHRLDESFLRGLVTPTKSRVDLLASSDRALVGAAGAQEFRALFEIAARVYRYVVVDVPRSDAASLDALDMATRIVVIATQELAAVRGASRIASALRQRYGKDRVHVVVNRFDKHSEITQTDVERVVGSRVRHVVPSDYRRSLQALNEGRPLTMENHNRLASAYADLARDLAGVEPEEKPGEPGGLFSRFSGRRS